MVFTPKSCITAAHAYSSGHRMKLMQDTLCGCFYCIRRFHPSEIVTWIDDESGGTAICPYCGVDAVIGAYAGYSLTNEFLQEMHDHWFT